MQYIIKKVLLKMLRNNIGDKNLTKRRNSNWSRNQNRQNQKQNCRLLPALSIKQLKINERQGKNKTQLKPWGISSIVKNAKLSTFKQDRQASITSFDKLKTPKSENGSFQSSELEQNAYEKKSFRKGERHKILPPINVSTASNLTTPPKDMRSVNLQSNNQINRKQRLKTDCKIILQKKQLFPFYNRKGSKSAKGEITNNQKKQLDQQITNFECSNISQIVLKQKPELFSKDSLTQVPMF